MEHEGLLRRLRSPQGRVDVVLDTDTYNEVDDQYALAYLLRSGERLRVEAIYAAPFSRCGGRFASIRAETPAQGMEQSYEEILHILRLCGREELTPRVFRGATAYLPDESHPVDSPAARDLAARAMEHTPEQPLYVAAIGAITNVASALLLQPAIRDRIVVVWLGGHAHDWPDCREFNLYQDVAAARVVFNSGAAVVQLPCMGVVSAFSTTAPELIHWLKGKNALCDYLVDLTLQDSARNIGEGCWSRPIWDVTAIAWLLGGMTQDRIVPSPIPQYDGHYSFDGTRHPIRYVYHVHRDALFRDLFAKLAAGG